MTVTGTGSRRSALATGWCLALAFLSSVLLNGLHVALEHHQEGAIAGVHAVSDHDDDHEDDHDDHAPHEARDHRIEARPASASASGPQLAPLVVIAVAPGPPAELSRGRSVDEPPLRVPDPVTLSPRRPRAPPLG